MKTTWFNTLILSGALACAATFPAHAASSTDDSIAKLTERWVNERDATVEEMADLWLKDKSAPELPDLLLRVITLEMRLATRDNMTLYTSAMGQTDDINVAVRKVSLAYLETTGWNSDSSDFVEGKKFQVELNEDGELAKPKPPASQKKAPAEADDESVANSAPEAQAESASTKTGYKGAPNHG